MAGMQAPSPAESLQRFIDTEDFTLLEKPLVFSKTNGYKSLQCCQGGLMCLSSCGLTALLCPIGTLAPFTMFKQFGMRLDKDSVQMSSAVNDCCCHVATTLKTVPLEKIQDVELQESCIHTLFGLKQINVQTAGQGAPGAEIAAAFLEAPEQVREALQLAVKLYRQRNTGHLAAPAPHSDMQRSAAAAGAGSSSSPSSPAVAAAAGQLLQRLQAMDQLVSRGVLSRDEANGLKVAVLAAQQDPTQRLVEAADLFDKGVLTGEEFNSLKASLIRQMQQH